HRLTIGCLPPVAQAHRALADGRPGEGAAVAYSEVHVHATARVHAAGRVVLSEHGPEWWLRGDDARSDLGQHTLQHVAGAGAGVEGAPTRDALVVTVARDGGADVGHGAAAVGVTCEESRALRVYAALVDLPGD